jgi:hypothetical protein
MSAFGHLLMDYFPYDPEGATAFYDGYGGSPPAERPEQARIVCAYHAAAFIIQGVKENKPQYIARGREAFRRIG